MPIEYSFLLQWEKEKIIETFKRCYGLQQAINKAFDGKDTNYQKECLRTLANQSGMGVEFLTNHLEQIKTL